MTPTAFLCAHWLYYDDDVWLCQGVPYPSDLIPWVLTCIDYPVVPTVNSIPSLPPFLTVKQHCKKHT